MKTSIGILTVTLPYSYSRALDDISLEAETPHITIKAHPWRSLKNKGSARVVPLVGHALWAAKRIKKAAAKGQRFAFPRYNTTGKTNANSASATPQP